jgi:hypothetical protein
VIDVQIGANNLQESAVVVEFPQISSSKTLAVFGGSSAGAARSPGRPCCPRCPAARGRVEDPGPAAKACVSLLGLVWEPQTRRGLEGLKSPPYSVLNKKRILAP